MKLIRHPKTKEHLIFEMNVGEAEVLIRELVYMLRTSIEKANDSEVRAGDTVTAYAQHPLMSNRFKINSVIFHVQHTKVAK